MLVEICRANLYIKSSDLNLYLSTRAVLTLGVSTALVPYYYIKI